MIRYAVEQFVLDNFALGDSASLYCDTSFIEEALINSTDILESIMLLGETFDIESIDQEAILEKLDSLDKIAQFVELQRCMCVI